MKIDLADLAHLLRRPGVIPSSPMHAAVQEAAREAGWTPPWDREAQQLQKKSAGERSGRSRAGLTAIRRSLVLVARMLLKSKHAPYASNSIDALEDQFQLLLDQGREENRAVAGGKPGVHLLVPHILGACSKADLQRLRSTSRDTMIKDLQHVLKITRGSQ
jgi:hypothetical protein